MDRDLKADVLVVGSGITGSLIAHRCVAEGYHTILIDQPEIAHGSSSGVQDKKNSVDAKMVVLSVFVLSMDADIVSSLPPHLKPPHRDLS